MIKAVLGAGRDFGDSCHGAGRELGSGDGANTKTTTEGLGRGCTAKGETSSEPPDLVDTTICKVASNEKAVKLVESNEGRVTGCQTVAWLMLIIPLLLEAHTDIWIFFLSFFEILDSG